jgi:hypothetical protein
MYQAGRVFFARLSFSRIEWEDIGAVMRRLDYPEPLHPHKWGLRALSMLCMAAATGFTGSKPAGFLRRHVWWARIIKVLSLWVD